MEGITGAGALATPLAATLVAQLLLLLLPIDVLRGARLRLGGEVLSSLAAVHSAATPLLWVPGYAAGKQRERPLQAAKVGDDDGGNTSAMCVAAVAALELLRPMQRVDHIVGDVSALIRQRGEVCRSAKGGVLGFTRFCSRQR